MALRVQSVTRNPARLDATVPTYSMRVAYALAVQPSVGAPIRNEQTVSQVAHVEMTANDVVCASQHLTLPSGDTLRICTLDDIVMDFLLRKASARDVPVSLAAFEEPDIWERAERDYHPLESESNRFIPYDEAHDVVRAFVSELTLPAT